MRRVESRRQHNRFALLTAAVAAFASTPSSSRGTDIYWSSPTGGSFADPTNWRGVVAPSPSDVAQFGTGTDTGSTYTVTFGASVTSLGAAIGRDQVTWDLSGRAYSLSGNTSISPLLVGTEANAPCSLTIFGGTVLSTWTKFSAVGPIPNSTATLNVSGTGTDVTLDRLYLGGTDAAPGGSGTLNISGGTTTLRSVLKTWNSAGTQINLSGGVLSVASLDLSGDPYRLLGDGLTSGWTGGQLKFTGTATFDAANAGVANNLGNGVVLRTGQTLVASSQYIGSGGTGALTQTGGTNSVGTILVGKDATAIGTYTVSGSNSVVNATSLTVGDLATGIKVNGAITQHGGTFEQSGGTVTSTNLTLGRAAGASGIYTISGGKYGTSKTGTMSVGKSGTGTFVQTGGSVMSSSLSVGDLSQGIGSYSLSGSTSTLSLDSELVGDGATGIYNGTTGVITQFGGSFDQSAGTHSVGALTVGSGSTGRFYMTGGTLSSGTTSVGNMGVGRFTLSGGTHTTTSLRIGSYLTPALGSSYTLDGAEAVLNVTGTSGEGVYGAFIQSAGMHVISSGMLNVLGDAYHASTFTLSGGTLLAMGGEQVSNTGNSARLDQTGGTHVIGTPSAPRPLIVGDSSGGTFNISGASSTLTVNGDLHLAGTFNMSGGTATVSGVLDFSGTISQVNLSGGWLSVGRMPTFGQSNRFFGNGTTTGWTGGEFAITNADVVVASNSGSLGPTLSLSGPKLFRLSGAGKSLSVGIGGVVTTPNMAIGGTFTSADQLGITSIFSQTGGSTNVTGAVQIRNTAGAELSITGGAFSAGTISNGGTFTLGPSTFTTLNLTNGFTNTAGTATFNNIVNWPAGSTLSASGGVVNVNAGSGTNGSNNLTLAASDSGSLLLKVRQDVAAISLSNGGTAVLTAGGTNVLNTGTLSVSGGAKLDLANNAMVVRSSSPAAVRGLIASAFNGGTWTGGGVTSSTAAGNAATAIGYASNSILGKTSFKGVNTSSTDTLVRYTYYGDSDLSGATTLDDFTLFLGGYKGAGTTWFEGDYDYNGAVTLDDFNLFLRGYRQQGAPLSAIESMISSVPMSDAERAAMLAAVQAVPEPAIVGASAVLAMALAGRRRARGGSGRS